MARAPERSSAVTCRAPGGVSRGGPPQGSRGSLAAGGVVSCFQLFASLCVAALPSSAKAGRALRRHLQIRPYTRVGRRYRFILYTPRCLSRTHRSIKYTRAHARSRRRRARGRLPARPLPARRPQPSRAVGKLLAGRHRARGHAFPQRQTRNEPRRRGSPTRTGSQRCKGSMRTPAARRWRPARRAEVSREARARGFDLMR